MNISIFSIAFNGYGRYVEDWLESILQQTLDYKEIILVLGKNHGTPEETITKLLEKKAKIIYIDEKRTMGGLINEAIKVASGEWMLRIDVDDVLTPNCIKSINEVKDNCDAVSLKFDRLGKIKTSPVMEWDKIINWRKHYRESGYVAIKRVFKNKILYYDDNDFPNFPFLFKAYSLGMKFTATKDVCVTYKKRDNSHSYFLRTPKENKLAYKIIDDAVFKYAHKNKKLSIIVPVYNTESLIEKCLDSIKPNQNTEIIIIDDCSTDNSIKVVESWIKGKKNVTFIKNEENIGVGLTVNKGYDLAVGEYVMTLCDDDYLLEPVTTIMNELDGTDLTFYNIIDNNDKLWDGTKLPGATKVYKRTIIGDTRRTSQRYKGDKVFYEEILKKNPSTKDTGILFYKYNYPREGSLMDKCKKQFDINVYTIAYNGYGKFLPFWVDCFKKQTLKPKKISIVLGLNHGANIEELKHHLSGLDYEIIKSNSNTMGILRNEAIKKATSEWMFYFSADDEVFANALTEIQKKSYNCDAVALKYYDLRTTGQMRERQTPIINTENMFSWKELAPVPGYIAHKRIINNKLMLYEEIEIPNYPFLFNLAINEAKIEPTDEFCAIYRRREGSHGSVAKKTGKTKDFFAEINNYALLYYQKVRRLPKERTTIIALKEYTDEVLRTETGEKTPIKRHGEIVYAILGWKRNIKKGDIYSVAPERAKLIISKGLAEEYKGEN